MCQRVGYMQNKVTELWGKLICSEACLDVICARINNIRVREVKNNLYHIVYKHTPAFDICVGNHVTVFNAVEWSNGSLTNVGQLKIPIDLLSEELQNEISEVVSTARKNPQLFSNLNEIASSSLHESVRESVLQRVSELKGFEYLNLNLCNELKEEFYKRLLSYLLYKFSKIEAYSAHEVAGVLLCALRVLLRKEQSHEKHTVFYRVSSIYVDILSESINNASINVDAE